jgi:hypothetical protein
METPRTGNCYEASMDKLISMRDATAFLVHGMPMGQGKIAQYGRYPHAWLELGDMVYESRIDDWIPTALYYELGQIEFAVRYSMIDMLKNVNEIGTYGPWPQELLDRDVEINAMFAEIEA